MAALSPEFRDALSSSVIDRRGGLAWGVGFGTGSSVGSGKQGLRVWN